MAKSGNSKVIFVPMQLQSDIANQLSTPGASGSGAMITNEASDGEQGLGGAGQVGVLNSLAQM